MGVVCFFSGVLERRITLVPRFISSTHGSVPGRRYEMDAVFSDELQYSYVLCLPLSLIHVCSDANSDTLTPLLNELTTALGTATTSLNTIELTGAERRQLADVSALVAAIITEITSALNGLLVLAIPTLETVLLEVEAALNQILLTADTLVNGLISTVGTLLIGVTGILESLGFGLLGGLLGLL